MIKWVNHSAGFEPATTVTQRGVFPNIDGDDTDTS